MASVCKLCPAGKTQYRKARWLCDTCALGQVSPEGATVCTNCTAGKYQNETDQSVCKLCEAGTYQPNQTATVCTGCTPGTYAAGEGNTVCTNCPKGSAQAMGSSSSCGPCVTGMSQGLEGQSVCLACGPGTYANVVGLSSCPQCAKGQYQDQSKKSSCGVCGQGKFQPVLGGVGCTDCLKGSYSYETGVSACTACNVGTYQANTGQLDCVDCGKGNYAAEGLSTCTKCPAGTYGEWERGDICPDCGVGTYQGQEGSSYCALCSEGSIQDGKTSRTVCQKCQPGTFQENTGKSFCVNCGAGKYQASQGGSKCDTCTACQAGSVWTSGCNGLINGVCEACPAGAYVATGATVCEACPDGKFRTPSSGVACIACTVCTAGKYVLQACTKQANTVCNTCGPGTFTAGSGRSSCEACAPGTYQSNSGGTECRPCRTCLSGTSWGASCLATSDAVCTSCPVGTYNPSTTSSECQPCPPGTYQSAQGQTKCLVCATCQAGWYLASGCTGASAGACAACTVCASEIQGCTNTSNAVCGTSCAPTGDPAPTTYGWLQDGDGCRPGQYLRSLDTDTGAKDCRACPQGWAGWDGVRCERCGALEEPYYVDRSSCVCKGFAVMNASGACVCPDGYRRFGQECIPCDRNAYGTGGSCWACGAGNFTAGTGYTACEACPFGRYRQAGQAACERCALDGWYAPDAGSSACVQCSETCAIPGWRWVKGCPDAVGFSVCEACPERPGNSTWTPVTADPINQRALEECAYDCLAGFYHADGEGCAPCREMTCPAGFKASACTAFSDANCDTVCQNASKPTIHSHWSVGSDCPWACDNGYALSAWDYGMFALYECVLEVPAR